MKRRKFLFFQPYTNTSFSNTVDLLLHLKYYQRYECMILKMWVKSKLLLRQPPYHFFFFFFFLIFLYYFISFVRKNYCYCQSQDHIFLRIFTLLNLNILVDDIVRDVLEYFWLTTMWVTLVIEISLVQDTCHPPHTMLVCSHRVLYL